MRVIDLTGEVFGNLTAQYSVKLSDRIVWECSCTCGGRVRYSTSQLRQGRAKSCKNPIHNCIVKVGDVYGKLTVLKVYRKDGRHVADTACVCGSTKTTKVRDLRRNPSPHCGCSPDPRNRGLPEGVSILNSLITVYKSNAKKRNIPYTLTREDAVKLFQGDCFFCGIPPTAVHTRKGLKGSYTHNGIDRVDSSKGYELGNVNSCCAYCNYLKGARSNEEFLTKVRIIFEHRVQKR